MPGILDYLQSTLLGGGPVATQGGQVLPIDQQPPSFLSRIADGLSRNSNALTGFGMGLLSGTGDPQNGWRNAALGYQTGVQNDQRSALLQQAQAEKLAKQRAAIEFAKKYPQYGGLIAANPDIAETFAKAEFDKKLNPDKPSLFERMTPDQQKIYLQRTAEGDKPSLFERMTPEQQKIYLQRTAEGDNKPSLFERMTPEQQKIYLQRTAEGDNGNAVGTAGKLYTLRMQQAKELGIRQDDPRYASFVGTGKMPREDAQLLSATDKKAIMEADDGVMAAQTAMQSLARAKQLSKQAYEGPAAATRGWIGSLAGSDAGSATVQLDNEVTTNALSQLKAIFGAAPTEGERAILLDIQGSSRLPDKDRQAIYDRAMRMAQRRLELNQQRANELRGGSFYKPGGGFGSASTPTSDAQTADPLGIR